MRLSAVMGCKPLVGAIVAAVAYLTSPIALAQAPAVPAVALPATFRNAPADAIESRAHDAALGEPALARLIALAHTHNPARAQAVARISSTRRTFGGGDIELRMHRAELARLDHQLAEEIAHAWFDWHAAAARIAIADVLDALAAQGLQLVNQRLAAGLATQADLERMHEAAIKARSLRARAVQERGAAAARIAALTGEQGAPAVATAPAQDTPRASITVPAAPPAPAAATGALASPIRAAAPAALFERPDVRAARVRLEVPGTSPAELAAFYREAVLKALEETETAYAAAVSARAQRSTAAELRATAERQQTAVLAQLEAGRVGRLQHIEAQLAAQEAQLRVTDAEAAYAKSLATLERMLGN